MILVPFPHLIKIRKNQVTLLLMSTLVMMHFLVKEYEVSSSTSMNVPKAESEIFHSVQAQLYKNFLESEKKLNKNQRMVASLGEQDKTHRILSSMSLKDPFFDPFSVSRKGVDEVSFRHWTEMYYVIKEFSAVNSANLLGIRSDEWAWQNWISYMFIHSGFYHLLSNLIFLFLFGALIERSFGGLMTLVVFLGSGLVSVPIYILMTGVSTVPLIGASGGVCGLIAFYSICKFKEPMRFFYWVLPFEKYYGYVTLYTGVILFLWLLSDVAGHLGAVPYIDSVAHAAHLGGFIAGASAGLSVLAYRKWKLGHNPFSNFSKIPPVENNLASF